MTRRRLPAYAAIVSQLCLCLPLCLTLLLTACDRRLLEEIEYSTANVRINLDWDYYFTSKRPEVNPEQAGMSFVLYDDNGQNPSKVWTTQVRSRELKLREGTYKLAVVNENIDDDNAFASFAVDGYPSYDQVGVRAKPITQRVNESWDRGITYQCDPLEAVGATIDTIRITRDMLTNDMGFKPHEPIRRSQATLANDGFYEYYDSIYPLTSTLYIYVFAKGLNHVKANGIQGYITGMADGRYFAHNYCTERTQPIYLEPARWSITKAENQGRQGYITAQVPVFGLPHGKELDRNNSDNILHLHFTLTNDKVYDLHIQVGDSIHYRQGTEHYTSRASLELDLELQLDEDWGIYIPQNGQDPDDPNYDPNEPYDPKDPDNPKPEDDPDNPDNPGSGGGGGFDAKVDEWEDGGTVDVGM